MRYRLRITSGLLGLLALPALLASCGSSAICGEGEVSLRILEPETGDTVRGDNVLVSIEACGLEPGENVRLLLLAPVEADYGFLPYEGRPELGIEVPTLPGEMRFVATDMEDDIRSQEVTVQVESSDP